jgi:hypothetical protein
MATSSTALYVSSKADRAAFRAPARPRRPQHASVKTTGGSFGSEISAVVDADRPF